MTKKYTSQDRPPWPQTDVILPLIGSSSRLCGGSSSQNSLGVQRCWVCSCAKGSANTCWPRLFPLWVGQLTPLCLCLPTCRLAAVIEHLMQIPGDAADGRNLHQGVAFTLQLSLYTLPAQECVPCFSSVSRAHQHVAMGKFSVWMQRVFLAQSPQWFPLQLWSECGRHRREPGRITTGL